MLRRGLGLVALDLGGADGARVAGGQRRQGGFLLGIGGFFLRAPGFRRIRQRRHIPPAVLQHDAPVRAELVLADPGDDLRRVVLARGIERRQHPPDDHIVQLPLIFGQAVQIDSLRRGQNRVVVGDLRFVNRALADGQLPIRQRARHKRLIAFRQHLHRLHNARNHVRRQIAAVRARVGEGFARFVEGLGELERLIGGEAEQAVRVALEAGQVVELGRQVAAAGGFGAYHCGGLILDLRGEGFRVVDFGDVRVRLQALTEVHAAVVAEIRRDGRVFLRLEVLDFLPPLDQNRKRWGLHAPDGQQRVIAQGKSAAGVHAHKPIRL